MSNLSMAQDYPTVFTIQEGTFSCLLYMYAKVLSYLIICMFLSSVHFIQNYPSFEANSFRDRISIKKFEFRSGPTFCWV